MKKFKKIAIIGAIVLAVGTTSLTALAASNYSTPAEAAAGLTGKSEESVQAERSEGKTYGAIAAEAGKLEEFKNEMLEIRKDALTQRVASGTLTQERADEILAAMEERQANCDGTGQGKGTGSGCGYGKGLGQGGMGRGQGNCSGSCSTK